MFRAGGFKQGEAERVFNKNRKFSDSPAAVEIHAESINFMASLLLRID
jgi:hypothetical protein